MKARIRKAEFHEALTSKAWDSLNQEDSQDAIWHKIVVSGHSHHPVYAGHRDT